MFAYCGNNPIMLCDRTGWAFTPNTVCINDGGGSGSFSYIKRLIEAMISNIRSSNYICDQSADGIGNQKLELFTVAHGGCGVVATYNALITLGAEQPFEQVLSYFNSGSGRTVLWGLAGILPSTVAQFFRDSGYRVVIASDCDAIDLYSRTADACILWYTFPDPENSRSMFGAHFIEYHRMLDGYIGLNTSENDGAYMFYWPSDYGYEGSRDCAVGIFIFK